MMKIFHLRNRPVIIRITEKMIGMVIIALLSFTSARAAQIEVALSGPSSDFMNGNVAVRTGTGISNLSIRLIDFLMGIQTDKSWEERSDARWILKTWFKDPVTNTRKTYVLEFNKKRNLIVLTTVSFDNHMLSYPEMRTFADQVILNFGKHVSPK
jgi:hypothetical protein